MNAQSATSSPFDIARFPFVGTLVTATWTFFNRLVNELSPLWAVAFGVAGSILLTALSPNLDATAYPERWKRVVIYLLLGLFNAVALASAALGVEETAEQGLKAADN